MMGGRYRCLMAVLFLAMVMGSDLAAAVIQCNDAVSQVLPCESYLLSGDSTPSAPCCGAIQSLDGIASASKANRKAICQCFMQTARSFPINLAKAQQLPQLCHVTLGVAIDPNVNCDNI